MVYIFAALESLLHQNEQEPIMSNIADRIAFLMGNTAEERIAIVANVKTTYDLRSKFVHHGKRVANSDLQTVREFMKTTWFLFLSLTTHLHEYATQPIS